LLNEINSQLKKAKEDLYYKKKWENDLQQLLLRKKELKKQVQNFREVWLKEKEDVDKLEKVTLTNIFYSFIGRKLEKEEKERQEEAAARIKYESHKKELEDIEKEILTINQKLQTVKDAVSNYHELLMEKENFLHSSNLMISNELNETDNEIADLTIEQKELKEALLAGRSALDSLKFAYNSLKSAEGWSTYDMLGGGTISTYLKRSKLDEAERLINQAQTKLRRFQMELQDINAFFNSQFQITGFLSFADYIFDNFFVDWSIHGKIKDSLHNVEKTSDKVQQLLIKIEQQFEVTKFKLEQLKEKRKQLIENA